MALGERIKQARLEMGLSQRQLCGEEITRNMLSQIENGSARPSMSTLAYLAQQLEKPISWFLEESSAVSYNQDCITRAREAYAGGDYGQVCCILEQYRCPDPVFDPERWLLEALSLMNQAAQAVDQEKYVFAGTLLEKAEKAAKKLPYEIPGFRRERVLLAYSTGQESAQTLAQKLPRDNREILLQAEALLQQEAFDRAAALLDGAGVSGAKEHFLRAQAARGREDYVEAIEHYLAAESAYPMECARALEQCYSAIEDYKMAYHYACKQRNL